MGTNEFGKFLRQYREHAGLSMGQLAKLAEISQPYISQIENGSRGVPSPDILRKLGEPLGVAYSVMLRQAGYWDDLDAYDPGAEIEQAERFKELEGFVKVGRFTLNKLPDLIIGFVLGSELIERYISDLIESMRHPHEESYIDEFASSFDGYRNGTGELDILDLKSMIYQQSGIGRHPLLGTDEEAAKLFAMLTILEKVEETEVDLQRIEYRSKKLLDIDRLLANDSAAYNGNPLTYQDRQRILDVLKALFPDYQQPPTAVDNNGGGDADPERA